MRFWTGVALLGCAALVLCRLLDFSVAAAIAKLTASTAFIAVAVSAGAMTAPWSRALLAGLCLSWFGDAFLLGTTESWFLLGLVAFLLAHVAYLTAFVARGIHLYWLVAAAVPVLTVSAAVTVWLMPHVGPDMRFPVIAYLAVINLMVMTAIATRGAGATWLIPAGAIAFYCSDLGVAARQFLRPEFPPYVWSLPLYYAGQLMLAWSSSSDSTLSRPHPPYR